MADVKLSGLSKNFGDTRAVIGMDLEIADGEFVVLLGPTGAGKTTTLRLIAGLERPDSGSVTIAGEDVTALSPAERDVAFVFQQYSLYPHLSVFENLAFPLKSPARRWTATMIEERVREIAKMVRIDHKLNNKSTQLSGGEMQRVAIGRALVREPSIFLMDEPLSSLDAKLRADLRLELKRIQSEIGATLLYVTHDQIEAMTMADRIGILTEGHLTQIGSPREIYTAPANLHVAARLGHPHINLMRPGLLPCQSVPDGVKTIGARTEHILVEPASSPEKGNARVDWIEHLGDQNHLHILVDGQKITLLADPYSGFKAGDPVSVSLKQPLFFGADDRRIADVLPSSGEGPMTSDDFRALVVAMTEAVAANAERLTELDSAIGDGDHGANMKRGFEAVAGELDQLAAKPLPDALKAAGMKLVMTVGGASGPLVGTFFMTLGKELQPEFDRDGFVAAFGKAVDAVAARGKSQAGQKTMLDVLYPMLDAMKDGADTDQIAARADAAAEATIPMLATRGRASFLGERSIGHMDPGAASSALLAGVVASTLKSRGGA